VKAGKNGKMFRLPKINAVVAQSCIDNATTQYPDSTNPIRGTRNSTRLLTRRVIHPHAKDATHRDEIVRTTTGDHAESLR